MGNIKKGIFRLLLIGYAISPAISLPVQAAGDGTIVIERKVQTRTIATQPTALPDSNPTTVNPNVSPIVIANLNSSELSDGDIANVSTGELITNTILKDGTLVGLNNDPTQLPGVGGGAGAAGTGSIANTINQSVSRGMAPLQMVSGSIMSVIIGGH